MGTEGPCPEQRRREALFPTPAGRYIMHHYPDPSLASRSAIKSCMPELPEVQTVVDTLKKRLLGAKITATRLSRRDVLDPPDADLPALLMGRFVRSIDRRGKRIIFTLDDTNRFFIHLGMSGRLSVNSAADPVVAHTHLILDVQPAPKFAAHGALEVRFQDPRRFGGIWWRGKSEIDSGMGPEPLTINPKQLSRRLASTTRAHQKRPARSKRVGRLRQHLRR